MEEKNREIKNEDMQTENRKRRPEGTGEERPKKRAEGTGEEKPKRRPEGIGEARPKRRAEGTAGDVRRKRPEGAGEERPKKRLEGAGEERPKRRAEGTGEERPKKRPEGAGDVRRKRPEGAGEERLKRRPGGTGEACPKRRPEGTAGDVRRKRAEGTGEERPKKRAEGTGEERRRRRPEAAAKERRQKRPEELQEERVGIQKEDIQSEQMTGRNAEQERKAHRRGPRKQQKKGSKAAGIISKIILIVALAVFVYSAYQLFEIYYGYHKGEAEYEEIEKTVVSIDKEEEDRYQVDFDALKAINPDVVAWIRFDEPAIINYPVVQGKDNSEYLSKTFKGYENTVGTIFVNVDNNPDFNDRNTIIYGHHMNNGTMFNELDEYESKEFWEKYPCFYIYTPDGAQLKYQIYSAGIVKDIAENYIYEFADDEAFRSFLQITKESSFYDTGVEPDLDSKIVTLSTCTKANNDERLVVHGMLVEVKN